jgi:hypothetical protein
MSLAFCAHAAPLITEGLNGNPRQIKRFLNAFMLRRKLANVAGLSNIRDDVLVKLMILEYANSYHFRQLYSWQASQDGCPDEIRRLEDVLCSLHGSADNQKQADEICSGWSSPSVRRWIAMEPRLADIDLRDYFWVARDRLQSTLSNVTLVPPMVRRTLESLVSGIEPECENAAKAARDLNEDEVILLLRLLHQHLLQRPTAIESYEAYLSLIRAGVGGSDRAFGEALRACITDHIPPAVGPKLGLLVKSMPDVGPILEPYIRPIRESRTPVGEALRLLDKG